MMQVHHPEPDLAEPSAGVNSRLSTLAASLAFIVILIGGIALLGWGIDSAPLKSVVPGMVSMKVNTALGLILLAIVMSGLNKTSIVWKIASGTCLVLVVALSLATLLEYVAGIDLHIDNCIFTDMESARFPGRNAPGTDIAFLGLVGGFSLLQFRRAINIGQGLLFLVLLAPLVTLGGYLYRAPAMYEHAPYPVIALNTSVALMLLCLGGLFSRPDVGVMGIITSQSLAGALGRKLLPAAVGVPMLVGLLVLVGERAQLYTSAFASSLLVASCSFFFAAVVCHAIVLLWKTEAVRIQAEGDRARSLEAEQSARAAAEQANRMKDEFLSVLGHELRTPLNAILGWSQVMRIHANNDDLSQGIDVIERNAKVQVKIVEDLLDMSRIINGKLRLEVQAVDLSAVIEGAVESMQPAADARVVRLQKVLDSTTGQINGDAGRLQQAVWNLLSNAIKFTPKGGCVTVTLSRAQSHALISVTDTGAGISTEFLPYVFERFRQADSTTTRRFGGLGLGLSIVKHLIELHGGNVTAESDGEGQGSTFTLSLPLMSVIAKPSPQSLSHDDDLMNVSAKPEFALLRGLQVLVVDDEPDCCVMVKRLLEASNATATVASSVDEAITLFDQHGTSKGFDVLVSDIGMPKRDGLDFIRTVRKRPANRGGMTPAVALTAYARSDERTKALTAGFDIHLTKPVDPRELCAVVARLAVRSDHAAARAE